MHADRRLGIAWVVDVVVADQASSSRAVGWPRGSQLRITYRPLKRRGRGTRRDASSLGELVSPRPPDSGDELDAESDEDSAQ